MRNNTKDREEEEEEPPRLSFCDYHDGENSDNGYKSSGHSENDQEENFFFELFDTPAYPPESIIFCGMQLTPDKTSQVNHHKLKPNNLKKKVLHWIMPFSLFSTTKSMVGSSSKHRKNSLANQDNDRLLRRRRSKGPDQISSSKSRRWFMLMFGSVKRPNNMDLADIKTRQKRRPQPKAFVAMFEDHQQQRNKLGMGRETERSSLFGLVRSYSCDGYSASSVSLET